MADPMTAPPLRHIALKWAESCFWEHVRVWVEAAEAEALKSGPGPVELDADDIYVQGLRFPYDHVVVVRVWSSRYATTGRFSKRDFFGGTDG